MRLPVVLESLRPHPSPKFRSRRRTRYYKLKMNIIFCPLTSRIIGLPRVSGFPQDLLSIENRFLSNHEGNELKWFQLSQERSWVFLPYTSTPGSSTRQSFPCKVQGRGHLSSTTNYSRAIGGLCGDTKLPLESVLSTHSKSINSGSKQWHRRKESHWSQTAQL